MLRVLLERNGEIVTREELKRTLWAADTFVDFDDGLNTAVKKIRDVLGDSAEQTRYIETIPRRGYRFKCAVERQSATGGGTGSRTGLAIVSCVGCAGSTQSNERAFAGRHLSPWELSL